jgi:acyl carrier protein
MALTHDALLNYLKERMGVNAAEIDDQTPLFSSGLLDSFSMIDLIMFIEKEAEIKVEPWGVNFDNFDSIEHILDFVASVQDSQ